uniref:Uncharacterized protein LOC104236537 n=1 Tax=Nicotiana sylvestris TaxID=4096 RepID=A0A1U7XQM2_NICSY|nr:PREDICTED: uncharacterized protein LOC104236537 [Nicotiana sylvestris]
MHIEKNVFDNIFNTLMDVKDKTEDNLKARMDVQAYYNHPELELKEHQGKILKPKAAYSLTKEQRKLVCEWVKGLRFPDGYASNLSRCVDMEDYKLSRMKSHDCHVFLERELHTYKKKAKNRARVEGSICEAYIIQEISTLSSHYFQPNVQTRLTKVTRNDDGYEVDAPDGCLSIFLHPGRLSGRKEGRYLTDDEWDAAQMYVLLNCEEVQQFVLIFEDELKRNSENISLEQIDKETNSRFAKWFETYVLNPANNITDERLKDLAFGPYK